MLLVKGMDKADPAFLCRYLEQFREGTTITAFDEFSMPILEIDFAREYTELMHQEIVKGKLQGYLITVMVERVKLRVDEMGAKLENEGVIVGSTCGIREPRRLMLNRPFWLVFR